MTQAETTIALPDAGKSSRLHEFQALLLDRMEAARGGASMRDSRLGVVVGELHCLLDLREASEIANLMPITKVPMTKDWYLGLANVRGNLVGVVDLVRFFGGQAQVPDKESRVIVVAAGLSGTSGFMVSRVLGLRHIQEMTLQPELEVGATDMCAGKRYLDCDQQEWREISLAAIIGNARFLQIGL